MEKQLTLETANPLKILVVEDSQDHQEQIVKFLKGSFPDAEIKAVKHLSEDEGIEDEGVEDEGIEGIDVFVTKFFVQKTNRK